MGNGDFDRSLGDALRPVADAELPRDILELLIDRALNAEDPLPGAQPIISSSSRDDEDDDYPLTDVYTDGINRARGSLVGSLADLVLHDPDGSRTAIVTKHLPDFARDPSPSVRACVARLITACLRHAERFAVAAYLIAANDQDLALATRPFEQLTCYVAYRDTTAATTVADRMLQSDIPRVRRGGGRVAAFIALEFGKPDLLKRVVTSPDRHIRRGTAGVCANRLIATNAPTDATDAVRTLVEDPDPKVRHAAAEVVVVLRGEPLRPHAELLDHLITSRAFEAAVPQLLITLEQAPDRVDDLILAGASRFVNEHRDELSNMSTAAAGEARSLSALVLRAYTQAATDDTRKNALDLIDDLLLADAYGVDAALAKAGR